MTHAASAPAPLFEEGAYVDVWSRTSRRHRLIATGMLALLMLLFAGLCCFTFWLRTGVYIPWEYDGYATLLAHSFSPTGAQQITLSDFLTEPIPVQDVPVHAVIMGLQFASLSSIPILTAILYRLPVTVVFAAMVFFLAAMPWLGIAVMIGCILATIGPFKFHFRYASALIGLIPIVVYFVFASREPAESISTAVQHKALVYAPWVLAVLGSCVICALALAIARLINYRPGGIPPVLATLFAVPVFLFHSHVGRDELAYRILERNFGPGNASAFASVDIGANANHAAMRRWSEIGSGSFDEIYRQTLLAAEGQTLRRAEQQREDALMRCDAFIEQFPTSRHVPNVLFIKARAQDYRVDLSKLQFAHRAEFRSDFPSRSSRRSWTTLIEQFPGSEITGPALHNLAHLSARDGDLAGAVRLLDRLIKQLEDAQPLVKPEAGNLVGSMFRRIAPSSRLGIKSDLLLIRARRLREMLEACRNDSSRSLSDLFGKRPDGSDVLVKPVQVLLWLDETSPSYDVNLQGIVDTFPESVAAGYVLVRLARREEAMSRRIQRLRTAADTLGQKAAAAEALFRLADTLQEDKLLGESREAFEQLVKEHPTSCWREEARQRLTALSILEEVHH